MKILVVSCDKNKDLFLPFQYCIEKYWPEHPEIIYSTETIINPYYKTIPINLPIEKYSKRIHDTLKLIDDDQIIITMDDIFIRNKPNLEQFNYICSFLTDNVAAINFQQPFSNNDFLADGIFKRLRGSQYKTSLMFQLWNKDKALEVFNIECDPWNFELKNNHCGFDYLITDLYPIDFGRPITGGKWGVYRGKWTKECIQFFKQEGLDLPFDKRGVIDG